MRLGSTLTYLGLALISRSATPRLAASGELPVVRPNDNTEGAGALRDGVLTVALEAKESAWHVNGPDRSPITIEAFSEPDKQPLMPGPLVRAP